MSSESLRPVGEVAESLTGKRPSRATVWRWIKRGVAGAKLEGTFVHSTWHTTPAQFQAFMQAMTAKRNRVDPERTPPCVSDKQLAAAGLL